MPESNTDRVFLSYARENIDKVKDVYEGLKKRGLNVWFDKKDLIPGGWKSQIEKAISRSRYFVICISEAALRKTGDERPGFQDQELNRAYNIAERLSEQEFTIVPVRIEECSRGDKDTRLTIPQQYDLFSDFEKELDHLAVHLGGFSLSDSNAKDVRTEDEKMIENLMGKAEVADFAAEYGKVIAILNSVLALKPDSTDALNNLGLAWKAKGEYDKAIEYYEKALKSDLKTFGEEHPNVAIYWNNLGMAWYAKGEYDKAIDRKNDAQGTSVNTGGGRLTKEKIYW
ncbi:MAG: TIR domain-containing protein, partial [Deltaproteobacteria bacterium]|nr:TIR domain-containing protein [Deltaproteobacteria bacterium]